MNLCAGSTYRCYNTIQSRKLKKHIAIKLKQTLWKHNGDAPVASERFSNISLNAFPKQSPVTDRPSGRDGTGPGGTRYTASTISTVPVLSQGPVRWKIWRLLEVSSRWAGTLPPLEGARLTVGIPETQRANG